MSTTILAIGAMIFLAHFLSLFFRKTNVPDVLVLMGVGLLLGPVLGWGTNQWGESCTRTFETGGCSE